MGLLDIVGIDQHPPVSSLGAAPTGALGALVDRPGRLTRH